MEKVLKDYNDREKGAYLCAITSIATADREASEEELEFLTELADSAELTEQQKQGVLRAAREFPPDDLTQCLDILKSSDLRYSLITDLISFANADGKYTQEERNNVEQIAQFLNITEKQFSLLDLFVKKSSEKAAHGEEVAKPDLLESLGLKDKMKDAGINPDNLAKGLLGIVGPILLAKMLSGGMGGGRNRQGRTGGGGIFGNRSRMPAGGMGGIGSLIGMLNGGSGYRGSGGILSQILNSQKR